MEADPRWRRRNLCPIPQNEVLKRRLVDRIGLGLRYMVYYIFYMAEFFVPYVKIGHMER